jgi:hypothetical protein
MKQCDEELKKPFAPVKVYRCVNWDQPGEHRLLGTGEQPACSCGFWFTEQESDEEYQI